MNRLAPAVLALPCRCAGSASYSSRSPDEDGLQPTLQGPREEAREKLAMLSAEQLASVSRMARRAYDACQAGDDMDAKVQFDKLNKLSFWF